MRNPFQSIIVRSVEMVYACDEALRIIEQYEMPDKPAITVEPSVSTGYGCTEAPRGICYHRYRIDDRGVIVDAKIVPPTSQNQKTIEADLWEFVQSHLVIQKGKLEWLCEQAGSRLRSLHFLRDPLPETPNRTRMTAGQSSIVIIGVGNEYRSDDGAGIAVARRLRALFSTGVTVREESGEGAALIQAWQGAAWMMLVDAVRSGAPPGTIHRIDAQAAPMPTGFFSYSTHAFSVAEGSNWHVLGPTASASDRLRY